MRDNIKGTRKLTLEKHKLENKQMHFNTEKKMLLKGCSTLSFLLQKKLEGQLLNLGPAGYKKSVCLNVI